jgi:hypothetical protein
VGFVEAPMKAMPRGSKSALKENLSFIVLTFHLSSWVSIALRRYDERRSLFSGCPLGAGMLKKFKIIDRNESRMTGTVKC